VRLQKLDLLFDVIGTFISTPDPATGEGNACGVRLVSEVAPLLGLLEQGNYTEAVKQLVDKSSTRLTLMVRAHTWIWATATRESAI
jgi:hypothetical protein